jgi:DDE superfamily endonuclease
VRRAIRTVGARLVFLPKYAPDLNPIEQVFAKFKTLLRKPGARSYGGDLRRLRQNPRSAPARQMRRIHQKCRLCVDSKVGTLESSACKTSHFGYIWLTCSSCRKMNPSH